MNQTQEDVSVVPCAVCKGTSGGQHGPRGFVPPVRMGLKRFGMTGLGCYRCYNRLRSRQAVGKPLMSPSYRRINSVSPPGLPARLKALRERAELLQRDVAEKIDVAPMVLCGYEKGRTTPCLRMFVKLAEFYGVTLDFLWYG